MLGEGSAKLKIAKTKFLSEMSLMFEIWEELQRTKVLITRKPFFDVPILAGSSKNNKVLIIP